MLPFVKVEAAGNDLVLVDGRGRSLPPLPELAVAMSDRHFGVGSDGLLVLENSRSPCEGSSNPSQGSSHTDEPCEGLNEPSQDGRGLPLMRMFNPDGTEDFCGNGLRCTALYLHLMELKRERQFVILSREGRHEVLVEGCKGNGCMCEVDLVAPRFEPPRVPVSLDGPRVLNHPLLVAGSVLNISCVSTGSTHAVIFLDQEPPEELFQRVSPALEAHPLFPERTSVLWCRAESRARIRMRIWERGVGETLACGSGSAAAAAIGRELGLTGDAVEVVTKGGVIEARWGGKGPVRLRGPARIIFRGEWPL